MAIAGMVAAFAAPLTGQRIATDPRVQGTLSVNIVWNAVNDGVGARAPGPKLGEQRFGGRISVRVADGLYVGMSEASWQFNFAPQRPGNPIDAVSTGVNISPYLQLYPFRNARIFGRAGPGLAETWAFDGAGSTVRAFEADRLTLSGGIGADLLLRPGLALTISADYVRLVGTMNLAEARSALIAGVGITVR
ncbi:MAG TPA: hypothetical protein VGM20_05825 [Gemmatimonadales bacterium]